MVGGKGYSGRQEDLNRVQQQARRVARSSTESPQTVPTGLGKGGGLRAEMP